MKKTNLVISLSWIVLQSASLCAAPNDFRDEHGWISGFRVELENISLPEPGEPFLVEGAPKPSGSAEELGPELSSPSPFQSPAQPVEMPEDLKNPPPDYDEATALRLAGNAKKHALGYFTGWCYSYVADAMEMTGIIRRDQWYSLGIGVNAAADFAAWANRNPSTLRSELKLAKIETPSKASDLPMGAIVVYNRGTCGFSSRSGHIEVKVAKNLLCSDGCQPAYQECFGSQGTRAGISVYVPVKKHAPKNDRRFCRIAGSGEGKCFYKCDDGSDYELSMKLPSPFDAVPGSAPAELCKQAVFVY